MTPPRAARRDKRRTSILRSKILPQGEFISPEDFKHRRAPNRLCRLGREADVLYGVTMQEQGVSRMLTINLNDVEKELNIR